MLDFESNFKSPAIELKPLRRRNRHDPEMGFLPLLASAIPMVASLAGSLLGKTSSKGGGPPPEAGTAQNVLSLLTSAIGGDKGETDIKSVVKNLIQTIPPPVVNQVRDAINQIKQQQASDSQARDLVVNKIDAKFGPQVHALLAGLKAQQLQTQATDEHNRLVAKKKFRNDTTQSLQSISERLATIEKRLNSSAIVQGQTRVALLGGRSVLER